MWLFVGSVVIVGQIYPTLRVGPMDVAVAISFTANYFIPSDPFVHLWSLCVEEHGYVLLSLIAFLQRRYALDAKQWLVLISFVCVLNGVVQTWLLHRDYYQVYLHSDVRMASILMSAALYLQFRDNQSIGPIWPLVAIIGGFAISVVSMTPDPIKYSIGTLLVAFGLSTIHRCSTLVLCVLSNSTLRYFGILSFSLYLWQQPLYLLQDDYPKAALLALLGLLAIGSFYMVERPARRFLNEGFQEMRPSWKPI